MQSIGNFTFLKNEMISPQPLLCDIGKLKKESIL